MFMLSKKKKTKKKKWSIYASNRTSFSSTHTPTWEIEFQDGWMNGQRNYNKVITNYFLTSPWLSMRKQKGHACMQRKQTTTYQSWIKEILRIISQRCVSHFCVRTRVPLPNVSTVKSQATTNLKLPLFNSPILTRATTSIFREKSTFAFGFWLFITSLEPRKTIPNTVELSRPW